MKISLALFAGAALGLSACSSVSVKDYHHTANVAKPQHIYVAPFDTTGAVFKIAGDPTGAKAPVFKTTIANMLADDTVLNVTKHVAPASKVAAPAAAGRSGWLITGHFVRVNTGSRALRVLVGLGSGGTKMETAVEVVDLASGHGKPFMQFSTTGGSNAMPGLITSGGPGVGAAYSMIYGAHSGVTDDSSRTSRMIAGALSEYYGDRGWIPKDQVYQIKRPGEYQLVHN